MAFWGMNYTSTVNLHFLDKLDSLVRSYLQEHAKCKTHQNPYLFNFTSKCRTVVNPSQIEDIFNDLLGKNPKVNSSNPDPNRLFNPFSHLVSDYGESEWSAVNTCSLAFISEAVTTEVSSDLQSE